jgi:hypothetical protein
MTVKGFRKEPQRATDSCIGLSRRPFHTGGGYSRRPFHAGGGYSRRPFHPGGGYSGGQAVARDFLQRVELTDLVEIKALLAQ